MSMQERRTGHGSPSDVLHGDLSFMSGDPLDARMIRDTGNSGKMLMLMVWSYL